MMVKRGVPSTTDNNRERIAEDVLLVIPTPCFDFDDFFCEPAFEAVDCCPEVDEGEPAGGKHSTTYATCRTLNGTSRENSEETGLAMTDCKLKK